MGRYGLAFITRYSSKLYRIAFCRISQSATFFQRWLESFLNSANTLDFYCSNCSGTRTLASIPTQCAPTAPSPDYPMRPLACEFDFLTFL